MKKSLQKITSNFFKTLLICLVCLGGTYAAHAQHTLRGTVVSEQGEALPRASILVKNTNLSAVADEAGKFSLEVPSPASVYFRIASRMVRRSNGDSTSTGLLL